MLPVLTVAGVLLVTAQMHRFGGGVIAGELHRVFGLGAAEIGLIMGAMPLASAVVQVPVGLAFDRFGTRLTVSALTVVALLGTLILALAEGAVGLALGRFLIGAGLAAVVTALLLLTMRWAPPERYASVAATVMAAASMAGGLLATVPLGFFLQRAGWTPTFLGIALITLVVIALCFTVLRDGPPGSEARGTRPESVAESLRGLWAVLADRRRAPDHGDGDLRDRAVHVRRRPVGGAVSAGGARARCGPGELGAARHDHHRQCRHLRLRPARPLARRQAQGGPRRRGRHHGHARRPGALAAPGLWLAIALLLLLAVVTPFYVTLTAHSRSFVPLERSGRVLTTINLFALGAAFVAQWLTGVLVALPGGGDGLGSEPGFRLAFGFLALMLLGAIWAYRAAPERPGARGRCVRKGWMPGSTVCRIAGMTVAYALAGAPRPQDPSRWKQGGGHRWQALPKPFATPAPRAP